MKFESRKTGEVLYVADSQAKTIRHMIMSGRYKVVGDAEWKESDHPRGANGQFGSGGGSSGSSKQEMEHNLDRMKKNIEWMEKGRPPQEKAGSHRRQLKELRESYATLKAKHEKEHGGSKSGPLEKAMGAAVRGYFPNSNAEQQASMVQAAMYEPTDRPEDIEKRIKKAKNSTNGDFESTLKHLETERHK